MRSVTLVEIWDLLKADWTMLSAPPSNPPPPTPDKANLKLGRDIYDLFYTSYDTMGPFTAIDMEGKDLKLYWACLEVS